MSWTPNEIKPKKITRWERFKLLFVKKQIEYDYHSDYAIIYKIMGNRTYILREEKIVQRGRGWIMIKNKIGLQQSVGLHKVLKAQDIRRGIEHVVHIKNPNSNE